MTAAPPDHCAGLLAADLDRLARDARAMASRLDRGVPVADDARALVDQALRVAWRAVRLDTLRESGAR